MNYKYVEQQIETQMDEMFPYGEGRVSAARARHALEKIARESWSASRAYHLLNLLTIEQALEKINGQLAQDDRRPISLRRLRAIAVDRHSRFAVGRQISRGVWLFSPDEIENLVPGVRGQRVTKHVG
jgi:hypothetical protein